MKDDLLNETLNIVELSNATYECATVCGDKIVAGTEQCDNGHYGCINCQIRDGYSPTKLLTMLLNIVYIFFFEFRTVLLIFRYKCNETTCTNICGDKKLVFPEECDPSEKSEGFFFSIPNILF
jgi:hypothetical protein